jgi:hypothetical protein
MATFYFNLITTEGWVRDLDGTDLADELSAWQHARIVAREVMRHREHHTRSWRLNVCDDRNRRCFDLLFASVDDTLGHLSPALRRTLEDVHGKSASLFETIHAVRRTLLEVKRTMARVEGSPYAAASRGLAVNDVCEPV